MGKINNLNASSRNPDHPFPIPANPIWNICSPAWQRRGRAFRLLLAGMSLLLAGLACNMPGIGSADSGFIESDLSEVDALMTDVGISLDEVMADPELDERLETLELLGAPDSFTLQWQELEGQAVRWEEWSYYDFEARFDFVDGVLLWTLEIDQAPNGTIFAHYYDPLAFEYGMGLAEIAYLLPEIEFTEISLEEADIPGGVLYAGDQILLGFDQDALVFVQTFILEPEESLDE